MFSRIQHFCRKSYVILPLLGIFIFVSCRKDKIASKITETKLKSASISDINTFARNGNSYKGEDIFEAIFFLAGPAVHEIPSLSYNATQFESYFDTHKEEGKQIKDIQKETMKEIKQTDPDFFDNFENTIKSENLYAIENSLKEAALQFRRALLINPHYGAIFQASDSLVKDSLAVQELKNLDLSTTQGHNRFLDIINEHAPKAGDGTPLFDVRVVLPIFVYAVAVILTVFAFFYTAIVVFNLLAMVTLLFIYEVYFIAGRSGVTNTTREILVAEIADAF